MFSYLFRAVIKLYWCVVPVENRRNCLFNESCSRHVYRKLEEEGFISGISALQVRYNRCRPGYKLVKKDKTWELTLADGTILKNEEISKQILQQKN